MIFSGLSIGRVGSHSEGVVLSFATYGLACRPAIIAEEIVGIDC